MTSMAPPESEAFLSILSFSEVFGRFSPINGRHQSLERIMSFSRRTLLAAAASAATASALSAAGAADQSGSASPAAEASTFPRHRPLGRGIGAMPGRVVWSHEPAAVHWTGEGYWWELEHYDEAVVRRMLDRAVAALAGEAVPEARSGRPEALQMQRAWQKLFEAHNRRRGLKAGYVHGEKIAVKVNMNGSGAYGSDAPGFTEESYGSAALMRALLESLVEYAGVAPEDIVFYDAGRVFPKYLMQHVSAGKMAGVVFRHRDPGGPLDAAPEKSMPIRWAGRIRGETSYLPRCVVEARYLINLANLKGHCYGLTLCGKNHFGSFVNSDRMRAPQAAGLHGNVAGASAGDYSVLVDLMAHAHLGGKTVLYLLDGLLTATGESVSLTAEAARWSMPPFSGSFCASLFASQDPVAIDSVGADFLMNEPNMVSRNCALAGNTGVENYLHEAAQAGDPPSGTHYGDGLGGRVESLGVHEHWNNVREKRYSRNLGEAEGIELVRV